jgi:hypothetical protein
MASTSGSVLAVSDRVAQISRPAPASVKAATVSTAVIM